MPIRVYYYSPAECGLKEFAPGLMRLAGAQAVTDPRQADVFAVPTILHNIGKDNFGRLPYLPGRPRRHVAWNLADDMLIHYPCGPLYLRAEAVRSLVDRCASVHGWPWPVEDLYAPDVQFDLDIVFQGWASSPLTDTVVDAVRQTNGLRAHLQTHAFFYGYHDRDPAFAHYRASFIDTLRRSRLSLVPRSIAAGVIRYRFYEALSAGRIPVHFCDGRVLPWADKIDYEICALHLAEADASRAGSLIADWLASHSDSEIRERGEYGRAMWLKWLAPSRWPELFTQAVEEWLAR